MPLLPSLIVTSLIDDRAAGAVSSLVMVPVPGPSLMVAPLVAPDRLTTKASSDSNLVSPLMVTEIVCVVSPCGEMQRPGSRDVVVVGDVALPSAVAKLTSNAAVPPLRVTVKVATLLPLLPSLIVTSSIEIEPTAPGRRW